MLITLTNKNPKLREFIMSFLAEKDKEKIPGRTVYSDFPNYQPIGVFNTYNADLLINTITDTLYTQEFTHLLISSRPRSIDIWLGANTEKDLGFQFRTAREMKVTCREYKNKVLLFCRNQKTETRNVFSINK